MGLKVSRKRVEVVKENKPEVKTFEETLPAAEPTQLQLLPLTSTPQVEEVEKVEIVEKKPKKIFKAKNIVVSESLRNKKLAGKSKSMNEMLIALGATPVPHVGTFTKNTFLICSIKDYKRQSGVYRDAKNKKIPIVKEKFLHDCIKNMELVSMNDYLLYKPPNTEVE